MWIFDFDGVLLNSLDEVVISAYNAATGKTLKAIHQLPADLVNLFKRNRFHFQPAGDVLPLMRWCLENYRSKPDKLLARSEFLDIIQKTDEPLIARTEHFYAARRRLAQQDPIGWLSLNRPFQPIWNELIERGSEKVIILTNKNREAVYKQCHHFGLLVLEENIYAGDGGADKISNLNQLLDRFKEPASGFIDDSLRNLLDLDTSFNKPVKTLPLYLASWGFIGPDDLNGARSAGISVLNQAELIALLKAG